MERQKNCDPDDPADVNWGDCWDHVAVDPESRLTLAVVPGARLIENTEAIVREVKDRLNGRIPRWITTDEYSAYESAIVQAFSRSIDPPVRKGPGRPRILPRREVPAELTHAIVKKQREGSRVTAVERKLVFGTQQGLDRALRRLRASFPGEHILCRTTERDRPVSQCPQSAEDIPLLQGLGDPQVDDLLHAVQLQFLLGGADPAREGGTGRLATTLAGDGHKADRSRMEMG